MHVKPRQQRAGVRAGLCSAATAEELSTGCNMLPCVTFAFVSEQVSECSAKCGYGFVSYNVYCVRSVGSSRIPVEDSSCDDKMPPRSVICTGTACEEPSYKTGPWQACSAPCDGGTASREVTCYKPATDGSGGVEVDATGAACSRLTTPENSRSCNTMPCETYLWDVSDWSACDAPCGGTRIRTATCKCAAFRTLDKICQSPRCFSSTIALYSTELACCPEQHRLQVGHCTRACRTSRGLQADASNCPKQPVTSQSCEPCSFCDDPIQNENCNDHGTCQRNKCVCRGSWKGRTCAVDAADCSSGVRDVNGVLHGFDMTAAAGLKIQRCRLG